jgi:hypothetical protein
MVMVINPCGQIPAIQTKPMAQRLNSLDGKTVYIVDVRWPYTHPFVNEIANVLATRFPSTKFILKNKSGAYMEEDTKLWSEIQEHGNAAILAVGH